MKLAQIVPPQWAQLYPQGDYRMVLAHWLDAYPRYADAMRSKTAYVIVDNGLFEGAQVSMEKLNEACLRVGADEVVLPDAHGDPGETLKISWDALGKLKVKRVMFVPQGSTAEQWYLCLDAWVTKWVGSRWKDAYELALGITSLRTGEGKREAQVGTRAELLRTAAQKYPQFPLHLLGASTPEVLCNVELPLALELGVRGLDTSTAYALGAAGKLLIPQEPKEFLKSPKHYDTLTTDQRRLPFLNQRILSEWALAPSYGDMLPTFWIRQTAKNWETYYAQGFAKLSAMMIACGMPKGRYATLTIRRKEQYVRPLGMLEKARPEEEVIKI